MCLQRPRLDALAVLLASPLDLRHLPAYHVDLLVLIELLLPHVFDWHLIFEIKLENDHFLILLGVDIRPALIFLLNQIIDRRLVV